MMNGQRLFRVSFRASRQLERCSKAVPRHVVMQRNRQQQQQRFVSSGSSGLEWRQKQLQKLERKFDNDDKPSQQSIEKEDDLQHMWREMEGRVTRRRPRTVEEMGGKTGRVNIKSTDEEHWMHEGLYNEMNKNDDKDDGDDSK